MGKSNMIEHIHISVEDMDGPDGFSGVDAVPYLDGEVHGGVIEVNTEEGWAIILEMKHLPNGNYELILNDDGLPKKTKIYGKWTVECVNEYGKRKWYGVGQ